MKVKSWIFKVEFLNLKSWIYEVKIVNSWIFGNLQLSLIGHIDDLCSLLLLFVNWHNYGDLVFCMEIKKPFCLQAVRLAQNVESWTVNWTTGVRFPDSAGLFRCNWVWYPFYGLSHCFSDLRCTKVISSLQK
jgi:hypothetical protein